MKVQNNTIRGQIQTARRQKIMAAVDLFFKHKDFSGNSNGDIINQDMSTLSGINYYFEQENWVFRERARSNMALFFAELLQTLNNTHSTAEQKMEQLVLKYVELLFEKPDFAAYLITNNFSDTYKSDLALSGYQDRLESMVISKTIALYSFNPFPVMISLIGMLLLPLKIIIRPAEHQFSLANEFEELIEDRKKLLPLWIQSAGL